MEKVYEMTYNNFEIEITKYSRIVVGEKSSPLKNTVFTTWESNLEKQFAQSFMHRLWYIHSGYAYLQTTFGEFQLKEKHVYFIPGNTIISSHCDESMDQSYIHFTINNMVIEFDSIDFKYELPDLYDYENFFIEFEQLYKSNKLSDVLMQKSHVYHILSKLVLFQNYELYTKNHANASLQLQEVLKYIHNNLDKDIFCSDLAKIVNFNKSYFINLFSKCFKVTPKKYIINKKINYAQSLLLNTNNSIKTIACKCGYYNQLHFSKLFKSKTGMSPKAYRIKNKKYL